MLCRQHYFLVSLELTNGKTFTFEGPTSKIAAQLLPLDDERIAVIFTDPKDAVKGPLSQRAAIGLRVAEVQRIRYVIEVQKEDGKILTRYFKHFFESPALLGDSELVSTNGPLIVPWSLNELFNAKTLGAANGIQFE